MNEEHFEELIREMKRVYHPPPEPPRERMWARIEARRRRRRRIWRPVMIAWPAAAVALLLAGIWIGRSSLFDRPSGAPESVAVQSVPTLVSTPLLTRAETLLLVAASGNGEAFARRAAELLQETRVTLDGPATDDEELRDLLEDLELTLIRLVRRPGEPAAPDGRRSRERLLARIRNRIPDHTAIRI